MLYLGPDGALDKEEAKHPKDIKQTELSVIKHRHRHQYGRVKDTQNTRQRVNYSKDYEDEPERIHITERDKSSKKPKDTDGKVTEKQTLENLIRRTMMFKSYNSDIIMTI